MTQAKRTLLFLSCASFALTACGGADDVASPGEGNLVIVQPPAPPTTPAPPPPPPPPGGPAATCPAGTANVGTTANRRVCQIQGRLSGNVVLRNFRGLVYQLSGIVDVGTDVGPDGAAPGGAAATLTIEPGTVIVGSSGADALVINRGSQIFAEGTATNPIVFTSRANLEGNSGEDSTGQWGGVVILGRAPFSSADNSQNGSVEGVSNRFFGGNQSADNSGRLAFVQVRFSGFELLTGNELNGITVAGVGSGTTINNVQIHNSSDDGIEWFGGRVNHRYLAFTGIDDDSIDTDLGYRGDMQFVIAAQRAGGGDRIIEGGTGSDSPTPKTAVRIANFTFVSRRSPDALLLRGGGDYQFYNGIITGSPICIDVDGNATISSGGNDADRPLTFQSVFLSCPTAFRDETDVDADLIQAAFNAGTNNGTGTSTLNLTTFVPGANETRPAFAASGASSFFTDAGFIGAIRDVNDTAFRGWTCDSNAANFGSGRLCTAAPADSGTVEITA